MTAAPHEELTSHSRLRPRSKDLHGARLGDLIGEAIVDTTHRGHIWRFRCLGCGRAVFLHAATARQRFSIRGAKLACERCMKQESATSRDARTRDLFRWFWDQWGDLYGDGWAERVHHDVLTRLVEQIAPLRENVAPPTFYETATPDTAKVQQRAAYLYPLQLDEDCVIECVNCHAHVPRAFGCVSCIEATCVACVRAERHCCTGTHDAEDSAKLDEIADYYGVSRERTRQVILQALNKLRRTNGFIDPPPPTPKLRGAWCRRCDQRIPAGTICELCRRAAIRARRFRLLSWRWFTEVQG